MSTRKFKRAIILLAVSLLALIGVQIFWIYHAIQLKEEQFSENVNAALKEASAGIEHDATCFETFSRISIKPREGIYMIRQKCDSQEAFIPPVVTGDHLVKNLDTIPLHFSYAARTDTLYSFNTIKFTRYSAHAEMLIRFQYDLTDSLQRAGGLSDSGKIETLTAASFKLKNKSTNPFGDGMDNAALDSILKLNLDQHGIRSPFEFALLSTADSSVLFSLPRKPRPELLRSDLQTALFPGSHFTDPYKLLLFFPNRHSYVLNTMWVVLMSSGLVITLLLVAFYFGMRTLLRQKRISEMKNDFINNMTHEFKTPVSVISLALETVDARQIMDDHVKLDKILNILRVESQRLETQVERILQVSSFERQEIKMNFKETDLHLLVNEAVRNFSLLVENRKAEIVLELNAGESLIHADEIHFTNLITNLVDNAIKYRNGNVPLVKIETADTGDNIQLTVEDNGIGMEKSSLTRIFDKFYRIPSGDVHNIKGFGLGLSYVKSIAEAHSATIRVESSPGAGSKFTLNIPRFIP